MACPKCGCKTTYQYDDGDDPQDDRLERCAACGEVFDVEDHTDEDDDFSSASKSQDGIIGLASRPGKGVMKTTFEKLPEVDGSVACLTCGCGARSDLNIERTIAVGFGSAGYSRDGVTLWDEGTTEQCEEQFPTVGDVEELAKADPDHDWRIFFFAPLYEAEYQRQGDGVWVLVRKGPGFA